MKTIAFFNNKGGVGKTSLVYHLAWMFADRGISTLAVDLDPQANLTAMFLDEDRLEDLWPDGEHPETVYGAIRPIDRGIGDIMQPHVEIISNNLGLIAGDLSLSKFEDKLSESWSKCQIRDEAAFRIMTAFYRLILLGAEEIEAKIVLIDVGPNLGAINRAAIIASERIVIPLAADLFSLQGLKNLGPALREWRLIWDELLGKAPRQEDLALPKGQMDPVGYVVMQHSVKENRPVKAYLRWMNRIPSVYRESVLGEENLSLIPKVEKDPYKLSLLKHYRSLMPMAMEARKPIFFLKPADGVIGAHTEAVKECYDDFLNLAKIIAKNTGVTFK
jgi:cellulose biosynthesis protein BcsQ